MTEVSLENVFALPVGYFSIGPSASGYTLQYSADGVNFTSYDNATPANEVLLVCGFPKNTYYKLSGNTSNNVTINY